MINEYSLDVLCLTSQVTKVLTWLGDQSPIKATSDCLPVIYDIVMSLFLQTSSHVAEYNMLQYMQQIFPSFISKSLLANAKTQSNERGLTIVEEVEEEEEEEEEEGSSHNGVHQNGSQPKEARKKVNEMPLLPGKFCNIYLKVLFDKEVEIAIQNLSP